MTHADRKTPRPETAVPTPPSPNAERARAYYADPKRALVDVPALSALLDAVAAEAEARGRAAAEMAVRFARFEEREACARECEALAMLMENGAGEWRPGNRLRQAARNIRRRGEAEKKGGG